MSAIPAQNWWHFTRLACWRSCIQWVLFPPLLIGMGGRDNPSCHSWVNAYLSWAIPITGVIWSESSDQSAGFKSLLGVMVHPSPVRQTHKQTAKTFYCSLCLVYWFGCYHPGMCIFFSFLLPPRFLFYGSVTHVFFVCIFLLLLTVYSSLGQN